jgi:hypothetical protein
MPSPDQQISESPRRRMLWYALGVLFGASFLWHLYLWLQGQGNASDLLGPGSMTLISIAQSLPRYRLLQNGLLTLGLLLVLADIVYVILKA